MHDNNVICCTWCTRQMFGALDVELTQCEHIDCVIRFSSPVDTTRLCPVRFMEYVIGSHAAVVSGNVVKMALALHETLSCSKRLR